MLPHSSSAHVRRLSRQRGRAFRISMSTANFRSPTRRRPSSAATSTDWAFNDVFMATGAGWYYSPGGNAEWRFLNSKTETTDTLLIGDFAGLGHPADVFKQVGDDWYVSWGGRSDWKLLSSNHRVNMPENVTSPDRGVIDYVIGNFVSSDRSDGVVTSSAAW
jgi:hypothetical protein